MITRPLAVSSVAPAAGRLLPEHSIYCLSAPLAFSSVAPAAGRLLPKHSIYYLSASTAGLIGERLPSASSRTPGLIFCDLRLLHMVDIIDYLE
ncbi:hypothetical protein BDA96_08G090300 [Sorghum bicolor]|uniref:Uncharacterized protein n=2 Tax=Sorghum bicolor TaxID=4558 RepID=A0A921QGX2_SORBI|nr:hypothetical protein BDA96_08G090300 [Sorghum bicolor]KXG23323.1 hypothetical protein SORBI_3008G084000 [Sorghum bicolor]